jgi:linoleoyl-CoA desaturase
MIPKFPTVNPSIHAVLKARVQQYFDGNGVKSTGNRKLYTKAIVLFIGLIGLYIHLVFFTPVWYVGILECALLGLVISGIGFNVMHDGSHGSFSKYKWLNNLAGWSADFLGANAFMWKMKHVVIHHSFTNVEGVDDDINIGILMRMNEQQKKVWMHRFQHWYFWFLYMLLYIAWVFYTDYKKYFTKKVGSVPLKKMDFKTHLMFWGGKVLHACIYIIIPIMNVGFVAWLVGFVVMGAVAGFALSIVFQLAHTVEHTHFPMANVDTNKLPDEFAIHQIKTTANFATNSKLVSWMVGGLNFQIEHHLFPKVSHVHYPEISKIVREVCQEFNITYLEYKTMWQAIGGHVRFLRSMGRG